MIVKQSRGISRSMAAGALLLVGLAASLAAKDKTPAARTDFKSDLTPENSQQLLDIVRPHGNEWRHLNVEWLTDVVAARKRAAAEDKPIIICYTGGAGYNEPLGVC